MNHEPPRLPQANSTRGDRQGTGRGSSRSRKGKFRGRAQYEQGHSSSRRGNFSNSRGYARPGHRGSKIQSNQCRFCLRTGHHMHECEAFSRHQKQELEKQSKSKDENGNRARGYVINSNEVTNENDWPYLIAAPCMTGRALSSSSKIETIIDSGATEHFGGAYSDFKNLKRWREPRPVTIADGNEILCEGMGTLHIRTSDQTLTLNNVWYVPEFKKVRLISVFRLNDDGIEAHFTNHKCHLWKEGAIIMSINGSNGLYKIPEAGTPECFSAIENVKSQTLQGPPPMNSETSAINDSAKIQPQTYQNLFTSDRRTVVNDRSIWNLHHRRLGHVNFRDIKKMVDIGLIRGSILNDKRSFYHGEKQCESCLAGRMKEKFNKKTDNRQHTKARRLHADISGIQGSSTRGYKYYLIVVDDATRFYWIRLLKTKSMGEVARNLKEIIAQVELESGQKLVYFRADNGKSEFGSEITDMLSEKGVQFEPCPPYKHSMNGVAERAIGIIATYARSMLFEAHLSHHFWDHAVEHAVWIRNRVPTSSLPFGPENTPSSKTFIPYTAWHEKQPKLVHLRPFGCVSTLAYPKSLHPQKWTPNIRDGT
ncbi:hypothetical protein K3495_g15049, partial [Podosphaera aphanis]